MQAPEVTMEPAASPLVNRSGQSQVAGSASGVAYGHRPTIGFAVPAVLKAPLAKLGSIASGLFAVFGFISLASWTADDPSLSFANGNEAQNWQGF